MITKKQQIDTDGYLDHFKQDLCRLIGLDIAVQAEESSFEELGDLLDTYQNFLIDADDRLDDIARAKKQDEIDIINN